MRQFHENCMKECVEAHRDIINDYYDYDHYHH